MKKLLRNRGQLKGEGSLGKGGFPICFVSFPSEKLFFITAGILFFYLFCLVNIHACCNQQIHSFIRFAFYQKTIYYEISFPLTLIFKYIFVKLLLLMKFIYISISLKTSNTLENKSGVSKKRLHNYIMTFIIINM